METTKFAVVFDEALCGTDIAEKTTCSRAPAKNSPHKHYNIFQFEMENGKVTKAVVNPSMHQKEVVAICNEMANAGVHVHLPQPVEQRVKDDGQVKHVTLTHEDFQGKTKFYIDLRDGKGKTVKMLDNWEDTPTNYETARRYLVAAASEFNVPFVDLVAAKVLEKGAN